MSADFEGARFFAFGGEEILDRLLPTAKQERAKNVVREEPLIVRLCFRSLNFFLLRTGEL